MNGFDKVIDKIYNELYDEFVGYGKVTTILDMKDRMDRNVASLNKFKNLVNEAASNYDKDLNPHIDEIKTYFDLKAKELFAACHKKPR